MADCQTLCDAVDGITAQLAINNATINTKLTDIYTMLSNMHTQMNVQTSIFTNIEIDLFNLELDLAAVLLDLDEILKTLRDASNPLNTIFTELKYLSSQFKGSDTIWDRMQAMTDDLDNIENALYDNTHTDSIGETTLNIDTKMEVLNNEVHDAARNIDSVNNTLIASNILLGTIFTSISAIAASEAIIATEITGLIAGLTAISTILGTISASFTTLNSEIFPIGQFFTTLKNVDDVILAIEQINTLLDEVKQSIESISIDLFLSKNGQTIQVKG